VLVARKHVALAAEESGTEAEVPRLEEVTT